MEQHSERAKTDLTQRQTAIEHLVRPLKDSLGKVEKQFSAIEQSRAGTEGKLLTQLSSLERTTGTLSQALRAPKARGRWGELHLRRAVEAAGMLQNCDFFEQVSETDSDGKRMQPDMVVRMPSGRSIAVDAKTPMDAWLDSIDTEDEAERERLLVEHAARVRAHVQELSGKYARKLESSMAAIVMYLPTEDLYRAALEKDPKLIEFAAERHVQIATPSTLIIMLKGMALGWREEALAENAAKISKAGAELYDRIVTLADHLSKLGRSLNSSARHYNDMLGSVESRLLPKARELREYDVPVIKEVPDLTPIDLTTREIRSSELVSIENAEIVDESTEDDISTIHVPPLLLVGAETTVLD
jgi:DNA recombination protein RmuC